LDEESCASEIKTNNSIISQNPEIYYKWLKSVQKSDPLDSAHGTIERDNNRYRIITEFNEK
jgi:hypothetical protein